MAMAQGGVLRYKRGARHASAERSFILYEKKAARFYSSIRDRRRLAVVKDASVDGPHDGLR